MNYQQRRSVRVNLGSLSCILSLMFGVARASAQFVEVNLAINLTRLTNSVSGPVVEFEKTYRARCLIESSGQWLIQDTASNNSRNTYYFSGSNIVKHVLITREPLSQDLSDAMAWTSEHLLGEKTKPGSGWRRPHLGKEFTETIVSNDGHPLQTMETLPWLAFCSGSYLRIPGRQIPEPFERNQTKYRDKTILLDAKPGLPRRIEFFRGDHTLASRYEVEQATNYCGSNIPLQFTMTRYREWPAITNDVWVRATGKVTSFKVVERFELPEEIKSAVGR